MDESLNRYGDELVRTSGRHGSDISSQRMDKLDVQALRYAMRLNAADEFAVDIGCGIGHQGLRFAALGIRTMLIDQLPLHMTVLAAAGINALIPISYLRKDIRCLQGTDLPLNISICYSQRFIQYLSYRDAAQLLQLLRVHCTPRAKLFLSAGGVLSELGNGYAVIDQPLAHRFGLLAREMADKHEIHEPVCLYSLDEFVSMVTQASFRCVRAYSSAFGNVKGIFTAC